MRRSLPIALVAALLLGCKTTWRPWKRGNTDVLMPQEEYAATRPAEAPSAASPGPGEVEAHPVEATAVPLEPSPPPVEPVPVEPLPPEPSPPPGEPVVVAAATRPAYELLPGSQVVEAGMIQVNDRFITVRQVLHPLRDRLRSVPAGIAEQEFRQRALQLVREEIKAQVEQALLLNEAAGRLSQEEKQAVEEELARRQQQALAEVDGSKTRLAEKLRSEGTDVEQWTKTTRETLLVQAHLQRHIFARMHVSRRMMWQYYQAHPQEFRKPGRVQMQLISAPYSEWLPSEGPGTEQQLRLAKQQAQALIQQAAAALARGEDFAAVARKYSKGTMAARGGLWKMMEVGSFRDAHIEQVAYRQKVGEVSRVTETALAYHIVRTVACEPGGDLPFEKVQTQIAERLRQQQYQRLAQQYLSELRRGATIIVPQDFETPAVDAAVSLYYPKK